ncbi:MAG: homoserine dehydrogenase [Deltaproteobacteria bacterium]|jgi:homoserine dehydrogenase|nr:MAG: homoserine dehydrogenase [Deltaproteobacteria bacterium]
MKTVNVGLIGAGTVGCGVIKVLTENSELIEKRSGVRIQLKKIADIDIKRKRPVQIPESLLTTNAWEIIEDTEIPIVIELVGGTTVAKDFVLGAIERGKHVVTANKALLALYGKEIFLAASKREVDVGFEASVGGGIPIIRAIREGYVANNILSIYGIINGTSNYILSKMTEEGREFNEVLKQAQAEGYAEADPSLDIDGIDAAHKLSILVMLSFGIFLDFSRIHVEGIRNITPLDISFANEFGYRIKLLAIAKSREGRIEARVHPTLVRKETPLADVSGVFNAIHVTGDAVGPTMLYGMGAGMMPTASAVVSDVVEIAKNITLGNSHSSLPRFYGGDISSSPLPMSEITTKYYLRFQVEDRPGVLAQIAGSLGKNNISIESVIQKGRKLEGGDVPVVIMTHEAREKDLLSALDEIDRFPVVKAKSVFIRIEEL